MPEAYSGVSKQIQVFASMADNPGSFAEEAVSAFQNMFFKKKNLCTGGNVLKAVMEDFQEALKITYTANRCSQEHWKGALLCVVLLAEESHNVITHLLIGGVRSCVTAKF